MGKKRLENDWVYVKRSKIHGSGVFAKKDIPAETEIMEYLGEKITKKEAQRRGIEQMEKAAQDKKTGAVYIFELNKRYDLDGNVPENIARFANHSCEENCEAYNIKNRIYYYTKRDISKGEEILIDYGYGMEHFLEHPCKCGKETCIGYIVARVDRKRLKKLLDKRKKRKEQSEKVAKKSKKAAKKAKKS